MPAIILIGAQWGDEGKGRVADWLAGEASMVARWGGGDNAGHTVTLGARSFKLHLIPSGIVRPGVRNLMGGGMVVNPARLLEEIDGLAAAGVDVSPGRLMLAETAHIVTPAHLALDGAHEQALGGQRIGTTRRGIGPAYTAKARRGGVRAGQMRDPEAFGDAIKRAVEGDNRTLTAVYGAPPVEADRVAAAYTAAARRLTPYLVDGSRCINEALAAGETILCEGAQGTLLDLDHGHYPYVTSSTTTVGGALTGLGFGPAHVSRVVGVAKAFSTRVGEGPFPTELHGALGDRLRGTGAQPWDEFGTTTGRPRRCGWLDALVLRYAARVNGLTDLALSKLDVLSGLEEIKMATAYTCDGATLTDLPTDAATAARCAPVYETLPGWAEDISAARRFEDLPPAAQDYVRRIEALAGAPVWMIGVGPEREQAIIRYPLCAPTRIATR